MSQHEDVVRLQHMLEYAREAVSLVQGKTRSDLETERLLNLALTEGREVGSTITQQVQGA